MKVIVLGGDGFCGWATSLHLSAEGHHVTIVDNLVRRRTDEELGVSSLTPIRSIEERLQAWRETRNTPIDFVELDVAKDYDRLEALFRQVAPDAIVHFAEQRAAPYSMKSPWHKRYTVDNNVNATSSVLCAMVEACPDAHLVHLGTMGVYGYGKTKGMTIPEGYIDATLRSAGAEATVEILYPVDPGSIYHMTKTLDQLLFLYYAKNDGLKITDLHQGIVWGTSTPETDLDERLVNRFDYDGDYGTVLNRFLAQAAIGHPLTVHGTGGQTRAFIHIRDTVRCIALAIQSAPKRGDRVKIMNQMTETHRVGDLAQMVSRMTGVPVEHLDNPRKEMAENDLVVANDSLINLGLEPTRLSDGLMEEVVEIAGRHKDRCDTSRIVCSSLWVRPIAAE
ncbi:NAD-dependent epimerase/dehydratase family protein [Aureimonas phyllosphaerae]|uniref:UDP-sulfoquinovose synthase n=1 Tax=Aureimonas phyllosphaerae TaxID=1166078 RepID=A0A7W6BKZ4_9HYPH|nr:NAD-dependent epimerase/dehydratase family protein [Aureimonas phyllosphaerae]MBB3933904.1 UDP-sulfoquinovose synthase [Aureimonas phyllosphaerae]MBB3958880.1 UDP-sulfoquinovose synthase [Aureimonas phyllosphaerae]SFF20577.1 UDP-sulfoquinovose synthase [Aureimonas phyllosphaerae]